MSDSALAHEAEGSGSSRRYGYIDGDLLAYPAAAFLEKEHNFQKVTDYLDLAVERIIELFLLDDGVIYLSTKANFRKDVYPLYKANREATQVPKWLAPCKEYLYKQWGAKATIPFEADDLLGIALTNDPSGLLISYDKDLKQIPGKHGDPRTGLIVTVDEHTARKNFLRQLLSGDSTDNCPGVFKVGPAKAEKWYDEHGWTLEAAWRLYQEREYSWEYFTQMYKCLYILRKPELSWEELDEDQLAG